MFLTDPIRKVSEAQRRMTISLTDILSDSVQPTETEETTQHDETIRHIVMEEGPDETTQQSLDNPLELTNAQVEEVLKGLEEAFTDAEVEELLRGLEEISASGGVLPTHPLDDEMNAMLNLPAEDFVV